MIRMGLLNVMLCLVKAVYTCEQVDECILFSLAYSAKINIFPEPFPNISNKNRNPSHFPSPPIPKRPKTNHPLPKSFSEAPI